jgi:hypothetical protein
MADRLPVLTRNSLPVFGLAGCLHFPTNPMEIKTIVKRLDRIATLVTLCLLLFASALAQDKPKDTVKLGVSVINSEYALNPVEAVEYLQGVSVDLDVKVFRKSRFRLGGVFNYTRNSFENPTDNYAFGPQLSVDFGPVSPFAGVLLGFNTTYNQDKRFNRRYRAGVDVNLGNLFVRPFFAEWERTEGFLSPATQRFGAGIGVRF